MTQVKRKMRTTGRPTLASGRAADDTRPSRPHLGQRRSKLQVKGKDPGYMYRWVEDIEGSGVSLMEKRELGYEFAKAEDHEVGDFYVYKPEGEGGSIIRYPAGKGGGFLYLMRIKKEWYDLDQKDKLEDVLSVEKGKLSEFSETEGSYGGIKIERS